MRRHFLIPLLGLVIVVGCSDGSETVCRAQHGAEVCVTHPAGESSPVQASGFAPNSELFVDLSADRPPVTESGAAPGPLQADASGRFPPENGIYGIMVTPGRGPVTATVSGTAASGQPVRMRVVVGE